MKVILKIILILSILAQLYGQEPEQPVMYQVEQGQTTNPYTFKIPPENYANLKEVGFSFWMKASTTYPNYVDIEQFKNTDGQDIAALYEGDVDTCRNSLNTARVLIVRYKEYFNVPNFNIWQAATNNPNRSMNFRFPKVSNFESQWIFASFTYSYPEEKATYFAYFSNGGQVQKGGMVSRRNQPTDLNFKIGACSSSSTLALQAQYFDVKVNYSTTTGSGVYITDEQQFIDYKNLQAIPPTLEKPKLLFDLVNNEIDLQVEKEETYQNFNFNDLLGSNQFATWGWAKTTNFNEEGSLLFKLSGLKQELVQDQQKLGDISLGCWVFPNKLQFGFHYYDIKFSNTKQKEIVEIPLESSEMNDWFFVYQGYDFNTGQIIIYVKSNNKQIKKDAFTHEYLPHDATLFLGSDEYSEPFVGQFKNWQQSFGVDSNIVDFDQLASGEITFEETEYINLVNQELQVSQEISQDSQVNEEEINSQVENSEENCENYVPVENDPNDAPEPAGDCVILYSECGFKGQWQKACEKIPRVPFQFKSLYVPEGMQIEIYDLPCFKGQVAIFQQTIECFENTEQPNLLGIKLRHPKKHNLLGKNSKKQSYGKVTQKK